MAARRLIFGGTILSAIAAIALALSFQAQQPLGSIESQSVTYCYKGVRTQNKNLPEAQCFTVADGVFTEIFKGKDELDGIPIVTSDRYVIPGLWDGHGHLMGYGEFLYSVDLFGAESINDVRARIKAFLKENPGAGSKGSWIRGVGWDQAAFGRMPTADDFEQDKDLRGLFIMLDRADIHCSWISHAVLDLIPTPIPDVPGGEVIRDPGLGVFCDNALDMVIPLWPKASVEMQAVMVKSAMRKLNELGLVGVHDASTVPGQVELYNTLADSDDWTVRIYSMLECDARNTFCPQNANNIARADGRFTVRSVKLFADGALGSWGSAMLEPYSDHPWTSGSLLINGSSLATVAKLWAARGFQVNIHAIGDLANRNSIDALEAALKQECPEADGDDLYKCQARFRHRIEHAQIIHPDDQARMHKLRIIPSIQPTHATSDMKYAEDRLGPKRTAEEAYRMKSLLDIDPILGSDFPVEPPNPFQGIYAAVTRLSPHTGTAPDGSKSGWHLEEALSLDEALWGFTGSPAYGAFMEGKAGQITKGAFADWVVLDASLESLSTEDLRNVKVRETWVAGNRVYYREGGDQEQEQAEL